LSEAYWKPAYLAAKRRREQEAKQEEAKKISKAEAEAYLERQRHDQPVEQPVYPQLSKYGPRGPEYVGITHPRPREIPGEIYAAIAEQRAKAAVPVSPPYVGPERGLRGAWQPTDRIIPELYPEPYRKAAELYVLAGKLYKQEYALRLLSYKMATRPRLGEALALKVPVLGGLAGGVVGTVESGVVGIVGVPLGLITGKSVRTSPAVVSSLIGAVSGLKAVTPSWIKRPLSAAASKVSSAAKPITQPLGEAYRAAKYKASGWLGEHWGWYKAKSLQTMKWKTQLITTPPKEPRISGMETLSLSRMEVEQYFWKEPTFGLGEVWVTKVPSEKAMLSGVKSWAASTQIITGRVHTPFWVTLERAQLRKGGILQPILQPELQIKPSFAKIPFIPGVVAPLKRAWPSLLPALRFPSTQLELTRPRSLAQTSVSRPKRLASTLLQRQPTLGFEQEKYEIVPFTVPRVEQREKTIQKASQILEEKQILKSVTLPRTVQRTSPTVPQYIPRFVGPSVPSLMPRTRRGKSREADGLFGKWFLREHPIPTPEHISRSFFGGRKSRTRKRKRKRLSPRTRRLRF